MPNARNNKTYNNPFKPLEVIFPRWLKDVGFYNILSNLQSTKSRKVVILKDAAQQDSKLQLWSVHVDVYDIFSVQV